MSRVLITGADGYLGRLIANRLREQGVELVLWVHATDKQELSRKRDNLKCSPGTKFETTDIVGGDLRDKEPFRSVDPRVITAIVHAAALTQFTVSEDAARQVNVEGSRKVFQFARSCQRLESLALLSTVYASGLNSGRIAEDLIAAGTQFANWYEWSKWAAEDILVQEFDELPWRILRLSTIIADDASGHASQHNVVHNTLRLFYQGLLPVMPGRPETPVYLVTGDFAARACVALSQTAPLRRIFHLSPQRCRAITLGEMLHLVFERFKRDSKFARRRVLIPPFCDRAAFQLLADNAACNGSIVGQAVASVTPFAPQLYVSKNIDNRALRAAYAEPAEHTADLIVGTCSALVRNDFRGSLQGEQCHDR